MYIERVKVRPRKNLPPKTCATALAGMLNCWASTKDTLSLGPCQDATQLLFDCMRTTPVSKGRPQRPTINYHLARLNKNLK